MFGDTADSSLTSVHSWHKLRVTLSFSGLYQYHLPCLHLMTCLHLSAFSKNLHCILGQEGQLALGVISQMLSITPRKTLARSCGPIMSLKWLRIHLPGYSVQIFLLQFLMPQCQNNLLELSQDNQTGGRALVSPL